MPRLCWPVSRSAALFLAFLAGGAARTHAQDGRVGAAECCLQLMFPIGARAVATGNALVARGGMDAVWVNPAGLTDLARDEFRVHNAPTDYETSNTFSVAFRIRSAGAISLSYRFIDLGTIDNTGPTGELLGGIRLFDQVVLASFASGLGAGLRGGLSYKMFQTRQACSGQCGVEPLSATTHSLDLGMQYHPPAWRSLELGASVIHLGTALQAINADQASPMPTRVRAGAAYELMHHFSSDTTSAVWLSTDVSTGFREGVAPVLGTGLELVLDRTIFVRAGYSTGSGRNAGAAVGVGLRYDRFDIGIAKSFVASASDRDPFQITFALGF